MFSKKPWRSPILSLVLTLNIILILVLMDTERIAASPLASLSELEDAIEVEISKFGLFEQWRIAKNSLALSGKLQPNDRIAKLLLLHDTLEEHQTMDTLSVPEVKNLMLHALNEVHELFYDDAPDDNSQDAQNKIPSARSWGNWYETDNNVRLTKHGIHALACQSIENLTSSEGLLRAAELLLFDIDFECTHLVHLDPFLLLKKAQEINSGDAAVKAEILSQAMALAEAQLMRNVDLMGQVDSTQPIDEIEDVKVENAISDLTEIAFRTNHYLAHLILARYYSTKRTGRGRNKLKMRDCDRAAAHLLRGLSQIEPLVTNIATGTLEHYQDRLSDLHTTGELYETTWYASGFASEEAFIEHELHLQELARSLETEGEALNDGYLDVQLGDLYMLGAPEVGIEPRYGLAERMYRRALRRGNGAAASQLAVMTLMDQTDVDKLQKVLRVLHAHGDNPSDLEELIADEYDVYQEDSHHHAQESREMARETSQVHGNHDSVTVQDAKSISERNRTAFELYKLAAEWGDGIGFVGLGTFYESGDAPQVPIPDKQKALEYYDKAAKMGTGEGDYRAGRLYLSDSMFLNVTKGLDRLEKAAKKGHVGAAYELGYATLFYDFTETGCENAVEWLITALQSDWTKDIPFDIIKGIETVSKAPANDEVALRIFLLGDVVLMEKNALKNAAFILERGHLPIFESKLLQLNLDLQPSTSQMSGSRTGSASSTSTTESNSDRGKRDSKTKGVQQEDRESNCRADGEHDDQDMCRTPTGTQREDTGPYSQGPHDQKPKVATVEGDSVTHKMMINPFLLIDDWQHSTFLQHSLVQTCLSYLHYLFSWPIQWRVNDQRATERRRILTNVYARLVIERNDAEARRKLGECFLQGWPDSCRKVSSPSSSSVSMEWKERQQEEEHRAKGIWYIKRAAELDDDGEALYLLATMKRDGLKGSITKNETEVYDLLTRLEETDPNAWFLIEMLRLQLIFREWMSHLF